MLNLIVYMNTDDKNIQKDSFLFAEDLAFNKPTWLQVPYPNNPFKAEYAVDGNTKLCAISADRQSMAEWRVDLGGIFSVHHIYIHYRTDNLFWGIYLYV